MEKKYKESYLISETYDTLFHDYFVKKDFIGKKENIETLKNIYSFTSSRDDNKMTKLNIIYNKTKDIYVYRKDNIEIPFNRMYKYVESEKLYNENAHSQCHYLSFVLSKYFENAYIITGYAKLTHELKASLHTILETKINDENMILDSAYNLAMQTSNYINLTDFKTINYFKSEDIFKDLKILFAFPDMSLKMYMTFRNELINELTKNNIMFPEVFNSVDNIRKVLTNYSHLK